MNARRLKRQRLQMDMTQTELAKELGVSQGLVSDMEAGKVPVSVRTTKTMDFVRREFVRQAHYRAAARITGLTEVELEGQDVEAEIAEQDASHEEDAEEL